MSELGNAFSRFIERFATHELVRGRVKSVDKQNKTCVVIPTDGGAEYIDVKLTASEGTNEEAVVMYPKVDSWVYIGKLQGNDADTFVTKMTEVEEIIFHNGKNGGMCITPELVKQLARLSARVDRLENSVKAGMPATGAPDSGAALITSMKTALSAPLVKEDFSKVENNKIKH